MKFAFLPINNILLEHRHAHSLKYCVQQGWIVASEDIAMWLAKLKIIYSLTLYWESLPTPGLCWKISQQRFNDTTWWLIQRLPWDRKLKASPPSTAPPPDLWACGVKFTTRFPPASAYCSKHWITWLVCLVACQMYLRWSFLKLWRIWYFHSNHWLEVSTQLLRCTEDQINNRFLHVALKLWSVWIYYVYLLGV